MRTSSGCWTCKLRKKKCDERQPVCGACTALLITCHYDQDKPEWMDGGVRQEEMAERIKGEVKEKAQHRRGERASHKVSDNNADLHGGEMPGVEPIPDASTSLFQRKANCKLSLKEYRGGISFGRPDTVLLMFYLEQLFPFLFPFYNPSLLEGGRAWLLEMMMSSPVVRQATLCQSSYFFTLAQEVVEDDVVWETVLTQTRDAFGVLREALQVLNGSDITEHIHGAVRIMASIMQVQRFEIVVLSFNNCRSHLNAALALFVQLLKSKSDIPAEVVQPSLSFNAVIDSLGPLTSVLPSQHAQLQSAEQAAFRFSSALLILDDIIASTVLQEKPKLYEYHSNLLNTNDGTEPPINLEAVIGCQNWVLLRIGEIAVLDAWKQRCKSSGNLDVVELVHHAQIIKDSLATYLTHLEGHPVERTSAEGNGLLSNVFTQNFSTQSKSTADQSLLVTRVWAHASLLYLPVVVSGWQTASVDVRYHVNQIIELLTFQISPSALLRTMVWPFCMAGCFAEPEQEAHIRRMVDSLQPPSVFGTVRKALEIMESAWCNRNAGNDLNRDIASCFKSQGDLVLLV